MGAAAQGDDGERDDRCQGGRFWARLPVAGALHRRCWAVGCGPRFGRAVNAGQFFGNSFVFF